MDDSLIVKRIEVHYFDISFNKVCIIIASNNLLPFLHVFGQVPKLTYAGCSGISQWLFPRA